MRAPEEAVAEDGDEKLVVTIKVATRETVAESGESNEFDETSMTKD